MSAPILVFGWGNPSRGDDALGPRFVDAVAAWRIAGVECLTDFQLQVEHALDLHGRGKVLFVDASASAEPPFVVGRVEPARDPSFTSHAMSPQAVLQVYRELEDDEPPPCWLLAIRGESFELGEPIGSAAECHLAAALAWARPWLGG